MAETRRHKVGITSNRKNNVTVNNVNQFCTHHPSHLGKTVFLKISE